MLHPSAHKSFYMRRNFGGISLFLPSRIEEYSLRLLAVVWIQKDSIQSVTPSVSDVQAHKNSVAPGVIWPVSWSGKAGFFFWDLIIVQPSLCPSLVVPLFVFSLWRCSCRIRAEKIWDRWWRGQKGSLCGTSSQKRGGTTDGKNEIMLGW